MNQVSEHIGTVLHHMMANGAFVFSVKKVIIYALSIF